MVFPSVREDNPRALVSGLSCVQVENNGKIILHHLHHVPSMLV